MLKVSFFCFLVCAAAAPQYYGPPPPPDSYLGNDFTPQFLFDTPRFWSQLFREHLMKIDRIFEEFYHRSHSRVNHKGTNYYEYVITIDLPEYDEKNIVVEVKGKILTISAIKKLGDCEHSPCDKYYKEIRTLPEFVKTDTGTWYYSDNVLTIVFPIKEGSTTTETSVEITTETPVKQHSREEMDVNNTNEDKVAENADVGAEDFTGDADHKQTELDTNEIPTNEVSKQTETVTAYPFYNKDIEIV